ARATEERAGALGLYLPGVHAAVRRRQGARQSVSCGCKIQTRLSGGVDGSAQERLDRLSAFGVNKSFGMQTMHTRPAQYVSGSYERHTQAWHHMFPEGSE
ncbi:unnamed protein product, partial [Ectocarpus sp. 13 AM-2016]